MGDSSATIQMLVNSASSLGVVAGDNCDQIQPEFRKIQILCDVVLYKFLKLTKVVPTVNEPLGSDLVSRNYPISCNRKKLRSGDVYQRASLARLLRRDILKQRGIHVRQ